MKNISKHEMYKIRIIPQAQRDLDKIRGELFDDIEAKIKSLKDNPRPHGCEKLTKKEGYRIRLRDYRILYRIDDKTKTLYVYRVRHRREVYR